MIKIKIFFILNNIKLKKNKTFMCIKILLYILMIISFFGISYEFECKKSDDKSCKDNKLINVDDIPDNLNLPYEYYSH